MRRRRIFVLCGVVGAAVSTAVLALAQTGGAASRPGGTTTPVSHLVRFDIARYQLSLHALMPGGQEVWRGQSGTIRLTGTGQAVVGTHHASGGGTWASYSTSGTLTGQGTYLVGGFGRWRSYGGNLEANIVDTISRPAWGRSGVLRLAIRLSDGRTGTLVLSSAAAAPIATQPPTGTLVIGSSTYRETTTPGGQVIFHVISIQ